MTNSKSIWREAYRLWPYQALRAASWGVFQIHAWNSKDLGYSSPEAMVDAFKDSEEAQKKGFIDLIRTDKPLYDAMKRKDWWGIGRNYNGNATGRYGGDLQDIYNLVHEDNPDTQRIAGSKKGHTRMVAQGEIGGTAVAGGPAQIPVPRSTAKAQKVSRSAQPDVPDNFAQYGNVMKGAVLGRIGKSGNSKIESDRAMRELNFLYDQKGVRIILSMDQCPRMAGFIEKFKQKRPDANLKQICHELKYGESPAPNEDIYEKVARLIRSGEKFYTHCYYGSHRTGAALAGGWIKYAGISREEALARVGVSSDLSRWSGTKGQKDLMAQLGRMAETTRVDRKSMRVVLIGDSNANYLNNEYEKYYKAQGARVMKLHINGSGCEFWLDTLRKVLVGSISTGLANKIYNFKPTNIDVTCLGGNDMNSAYDESKLKTHIDGCIKPLMKIIKKYNGTFAGTVAVGKDVPTKTGENINDLRAKMNLAYAAAAKEVGIPFWNPTTRIAYDTSKIEGRHPPRAMAGQEFKARKTFLGAPETGATPWAGRTAVTEPSMSNAEYIKFIKKHGGSKAMKLPKRDVFMLHARMVAAEDAVKSGIMSPAAAKKFIAASKTKLFGAAATLDAPSAAADGDTPSVSDTAIDAAPLELEQSCPKGVFVSKYRNFQTQVPDFDFVTFYDDLDKHFGSAAEVLKPQGKDCVFSDEHYAAWIKLQQKKQTDVPYVSESSIPMLKNLIKEMKKRY